MSAGPSRTSGEPATPRTRRRQHGQRRPKIATRVTTGRPFDKLRRRQLDMVIGLPQRLAGTVQAHAAMAAALGIARDGPVGSGGADARDPWPHALAAGPLRLAADGSSSGHGSAAGLNCPASLAARQASPPAPQCGPTAPGSARLSPLGSGARDRAEAWIG